MVSNFLCSSCLLRLGKIFCLKFCLDVDTNTKMFLLTAGYEEQSYETALLLNLIEQFASISLIAGSIKACLFIDD